jgi:uncharacterized protein YhaN
MIIEKIHIKSFGMLTDFVLELSPTINVIEGENESGKSTIAAFIKYMLYGFDNDTSPDMLDERNKRVNWSSGSAEGMMYVNVKDKRYLITRSTVRVENGGRVSFKEDMSITDLETGALAFGKVPAGEVFFGVDSSLFDNTAYIGQIGDSAISERSVKESIENILFSGSEKINNQRAASKISVKMENLLHKGGEGGVIYDLMRRGDDFEATYDKANEINKQILEKEARLHEIKAERQSQQEKKDTLTDLDFCYRNVQIINSFDKLHESEELYSKKCEEYTAFVTKNTKNGFSPSSQYLTDISEARRGVDTAYRNIAVANEAYETQKNAVGITRDIENSIALSDSMGKEDEVLSKARGIRKNQIKNVLAMAGAGVVAILSLIFEFVLTNGFSNTLPVVAFALTATLGLGSALTMMVFFLKNSQRLRELQNKFSTESYKELLSRIDVIAKARDKRDRLLKSIDDARVALENAKTCYDDAKVTLLETVLRWGEEFPSSNLNQFLDSLEDKVRVFLAEEKQLLDERMELEIRVRTLREQLNGKSEIDIRGQVPPFKRKVLLEVPHEEILLGISQCEEAIAEQNRLAEEVENELSVLKMNAQDPSVIYAKIDTNEAKIEDLRTQHRAYYYALRAIETASDRLREEISPRLAEFSTDLMGIMTNKKYTDISVDDGLKLSFKNYDGNDKSVEYLSGGTRDLTYVSLRMALIDMLYSEKPPVCYDESFAHQDNVRAKCMMEAIKHLANQGYQSIIFTCRQRESNLAKEKDASARLIKISKNKTVKPLN